MIINRFSADYSRMVRVAIHDEQFIDNIVVITSARIDSNGNVDVVSQYSTKLPADVPIGSAVVWKSYVFVAYERAKEAYVRIGGDRIRVFNLYLINSKKANILIHDLVRKYFGFESYPRRIDINACIISALYLAHLLRIRARIPVPIDDIDEETEIDEESEQSGQLEQHDDLLKKLIELARTLPPDQELEVEYR